jgi:hypothetical protein
MGGSGLVERTALEFMTDTSLTKRRLHHPKGRAKGEATKHANCNYK